MTTHLSSLLTPRQTQKTVIIAPSSVSSGFRELIADYLWGGGGGGGGIYKDLV